MSVTKAISNSLYNYLNNNGLVTDSDRIRYSLDYICASITKIAVVLIIGAVTGTLSPCVRIVVG
ncbi:MAG: accessory gene regulator B family protein [Anaerovoracaceae bacterium]|jgi:hypothetical protein